MTIFMYSGTPGSGKTLHAASDLRYALSKPGVPRPCIANFRIRDDAPIRHRDHFHYCSNSELTPSLLMDFATDYWTSAGAPAFREDWILLILDEVQLLFNSRTWSQNDRLAWLSFFSQHRKYGYKIIFVAQSSKMIDNQFRMLVEIEINHRAVRNMGGVGAVASVLTFDRLFMWVSYLFQTGERLGLSFYLRKRKDGRMYDTVAKFEPKSS